MTQVNGKVVMTEDEAAYAHDCVLAIVRANEKVLSGAREVSEEDRKNIESDNGRLKDFLQSYRNMTVRD